ncbi:hypothetical protein WQ53_15325 [Pseudoxanthomonas suwonensis]|uniref:Uncharacterized protein n=1 Tax=Pseudoxanthomonas suwonensis TaxID=314722 RepID=A0A0E3Z3I4_9GAMM|nr:hypothetical protein WQ53_15325 [Pseudoxanthomonas suwonensis]
MDAISGKGKSQEIVKSALSVICADRPAEKLAETTPGPSGRRTGPDAPEGRPASGDMVQGSRPGMAVLLEPARGRR